MLNRMKLSLIAALVLTGLAGGVVGATMPTATASAACSNSFLTFPAWYKGLEQESDCSIVGPVNTEEGLRIYIWKIALNVVEIMLQVIGYIAMFFVIYGGFLYMTSSGNPEGAAKGLRTIINASIGVALGLSAIAIKNLIWTVVVGTNTNDLGIYVIDAGDILRQGLQTVYFIAGAVAVIVIIISGLDYVTAGGNANRVTKAKNMILYAVIGLVIIIAASAITTFVGDRF